MKTYSTSACSAALTVLLTMVCCNALGADSATVASASELLGDNCVYQYKTEPVYDPKAKKVVFTWMGKTGDIYGREYSDETKTWNPPLRKAPKTIMEWNRDPADRHNYSSVVVAPNGHFLVFQADHLKGEDGYGMMLYAAPSPGSIDGEWSNQMLWTNSQAAYPTAVVAGDSIYLFMRRRVETVWRIWQFSKSSDNGKTWTEPRTIIDTEDKDDGQDGYQDAGQDEIYCVAKKFYDPVNKRIAMTWNLAGGGAHNLLNKDLYMAYLSTTDDKMYAPTGANLGDCVDYAEMKDAKTKVQVLATEDQSGEKTGPIVDYVHHANYLEDGKFFVTCNNMSKKNDKQSLLWARWTGEDWKHGVIEEKPFKEELTRYSCVQQVRGSHFRVSIIDDTKARVRIKETKDAGETWAQVHEEVLDTQGREINCADFVLPYRPGYPQIMVTTTPTGTSLHDTNPKGDFPIWAMGDGSAE